MRRPLGALVVFLFLGVQIDFVLSGDEWTVVSPSGSGPPERRAHSAGFHEETLALVIFSGKNDKLFNDTWCFSLSTHQWQEHVGAVNPPARIFASMAPAHHEAEGLVVFGGTNDQELFNDVWKFSGSSWSELVTTNTPSARFGHVAADGGKEHGMIIFGGFLDTGATTVDGGVYRLNGTVWETLSPPDPKPLPRGGGSATVVQGIFYLFGGANKENVYGDLWALDLQTLTWKTIAPPVSPSNRAFHGLTSQGLNLILYGGEQASLSGLSSETWLFDTFNEQWNQLTDATAPVATAQFSLVAVSDTSALAFGGITSTSQVSSDLRELDSHPTDAKWATIVPSSRAPQGRTEFVSVLVEAVQDVTVSSEDQAADGNAAFLGPVLWVIGGIGQDGALLNDTWVFSASENLWHEVPTSGSVAGVVPGAFSGAHGVLVGHFITVIGGQLADIWTLNIQTRRWSKVQFEASATPPVLQRVMHSVGVHASASSRTIVVFGGKALDDATNTPLNDTLKIDLRPLPQQREPNNRMLYFNGQSHFVQAWSNRKAVLDGDGFSVEAMFHIGEVAGDGMTLLSARTASGQSMRVFYRYQTGTMCISGFDLTLPVSCGHTRVDDDRWHHVLVSFDFSRSPMSIIYIDHQQDTYADDVEVVLSQGTEIQDLFIGTFFPDAMPYLLTTFEDNANVYYRINHAPFWQVGLPKT